jgi:hypothetical protein
MGHPMASGGFEQYQNERNYCVEKLKDPTIPQSLAYFLKSVLYSDMQTFTILRPSLQLFMEMYPLKKQLLTEQTPPKA